MTFNKVQSNYFYQMMGRLFSPRCWQLISPKKGLMESFREWHICVAVTRFTAHLAGYGKMMTSSIAPCMLFRYTSLPVFDRWVPSNLLNDFSLARILLCLITQPPMLCIKFRTSIFNLFLDFSSLTLQNTGCNVFWLGQREMTWDCLNRVVDKMFPSSDWRN
jgi:hypothetical protein